MRVDGKVVVDPAQAVTGDESITVNGRPVEIATKRVVYALNKPAGVVSTASDPQQRTTVVHLVPEEQGRRLYPVGRLDLDTTGLILLTDDGELANLLTHPRHEVPKCYRARLASSPKAAGLQQLREGIKLDDGMTQPAQVRRVSARVIEVTIREGRNHQVRRMFGAIRCSVVALERVSFGQLRLGSLAPGDYRQLSPHEIEGLRDSARQ